MTGLEFEGYQINPISSGLYGVSISFENESELCVSNAVYYNYELFETDIDDNLDFLISCVPNPFMDRATIFINQGNATQLKFDLYDHFGKKIWQESKIINQEKSFVINNLVPGMYYFRVTNMEHMKIIPIIMLK